MDWRLLERIENRERNGEKRRRGEGLRERGRKGGREGV